MTQNSTAINSLVVWPRPHTHVMIVTSNLKIVQHDIIQIIRKIQGFRDNEGTLMARSTSHISGSGPADTARK